MALPQTTIILFLLDSSAIPNYPGETYLCGVIDTVAGPNAFSPARITHNNRINRENILVAVQSLTDNPDLENVKTVSESIWAHLGISSTLDDLVARGAEITFLTNDPLIPWEWASPRGGAMICERVSCSTVFFEQMGHGAAQPGRYRRGTTAKEQIERMKVVLLFDSGEHHGLRKLNSKREVEHLKDHLVSIGLNPNNIAEIDGQQKYAEPEFFKAVADADDDLALIHYAGHILAGNLQLQHSEIETKEITDNLSTPCSRLPGTLVFINGCESGRVEDVWKQEKNLATAWLNAGASNVIACRLEVPDYDAWIFAKEFYKRLLNPENPFASVGSVLRDTRADIATNEAPDLSWVQYALFGQPGTLFFDPKREADRAIESLSSATMPSGFGMFD